MMARKTSKDNKMIQVIGMQIKLTRILCAKQIEIEHLNFLLFHSKELVNKLFNKFTDYNGKDDRDDP